MMTDHNSIEAVLDHAIAMEQAAVDLYLQLAERTRTPALKDVFLGFAQEERGHKAKLEAVKSGKRPALEQSTPVQDLKIADYLNDVVLSAEPSYADVLVFAMKQEKQAFRLYTELAERTEDPEIRELFHVLALEEAKHKLRFEVEYDKHVLTEN
jgi:rubrerythrin